VAITIIDKPPTLRRFLTYDLEWVPGENLYEPSKSGKTYTVIKRKTEPLKHRITGVYDGEQYRRYPSIDAFLIGELTSENRGAWFYAHAGGLADLGFVLDRIIANVGDDERYQVEASFSGSSAIIVHVKRGKNSWHFCDSYWLLRDSLANIAKFIGMEKGAGEKRRTKAEAKRFYAEAPEDELAVYNALDCEILHKAISAFENLLLELGGQLQMTVASCALQLFRRKYLSRQIPTDTGLNARAADAYYASRVEVYERRAPKGTKRFDINSSFPYAMTLPHPGALIGPLRNLPLGTGRLFMADVEVEVPETYLPPLPYRAHGRVFFPTGRWRGWYMNTDLELLEEEGGKIHEVHEAFEFEKRDDLAMYATDIYSRRDKCEDGSFEKTGYKYLGNSLYGKFGESPWKTRILVNPETIDLVGNPSEGIPPMEQYMPGVWRQDIKVPVAHAHVPISAHIVATARRTLFRGQRQCKRLYYSDTDSIDTDTTIASGRELGAFKHEATLLGSYYVAPKLYEYTAYWCYEHGDKDAKRDDGRRVGASSLGPKCSKCGGLSQTKTVQRAKGFSEMDEIKFDLLVEGKNVPYQRMARLRELYGGSTPSTAPIEVLVEKAVRGLSLPKRMFYPDGTTRPWQVEELQEGDRAERWEDLSRAEDLK
jgi:DNA polymerase type B, organellar and viral